LKGNGGDLRFVRGFFFKELPEIYYFPVPPINDMPIHRYNVVGIWDGENYELNELPKR
jgi:hypothetical protein